MRYDERKSEKILSACRMLADLHDGNFSCLQAAARDKDDLEGWLQAFYGVGPIAVNIFLHEPGPRWAKADPADA